MNFYNNFQEFCEKNNLTKVEGIEFLEKELENASQRVDEMGEKDSEVQPFSPIKPKDKTYGGRL